MKKIKNILRKALACITATTLAIPIAAQFFASSEEPEKYPYAMFGRNGISIVADSNICVNGAIHTNKEAVVSYLNGNVNGRITTGVDIEKRVKHVYSDTKIKETHFSENVDLHEEEYTYSDLNIHINNPLFCYNNLSLNGNVSLNSNLGSLMNIHITGEVKNANTSVVYSKYGDITIENDSTANINGLIYVPLGTLTINSPNINLNGVIIADKVVINGSSVNINNKEDIARFIGTVSEEYDFDGLNYLPEDWLGDTDKDQLFDIYERVIDTDPLDSDTDDDQLPDGYEVNKLSTDPLVVDTDENGIADADEDFDEDNLNNLDEYTNKTEPYNLDTDDDLSLDGDEIKKYHTDPLDSDTDKDEIKDGYEIKLGFDPLNTKTFGILDSEYEVNQDIPCDSEAFAAINTDENPFDLSLEADAKGCVESNISIEESKFSSAIDNDSIVGIAPEIQCDNTCEISKFVVKFKININDMPECQGVFKNEDEFQGIKRYCIFKYDEELNILLPIETKYDENTDTIFSETDELGTYCLMDMDSWLLSEEDNNDDDINVNNNIENDIVNYPINSENALIADHNENVVTLAVNNVLASSNSVEVIIRILPQYQIPVDIVFLIEQVGNDKTLFEQQKKDIKLTAKTIFEMYDYARIYIIGYNKNSASFYKTSMQKYSTDYASVISSLDQIKYTSINGTGNRGTAFNLLMKSNCFRSYAAKFAFLIYNNSKQSVVPNGYKDQIDFCKQNDVHYSEYMKTWGYSNSQYGQSVKTYITRSDGIIMNRNDSMAQRMYYYIASRVGSSTVKFTLPGSMEKIQLKQPLLPDNYVDSDGDGVSDWNEVDHNFGLIKWNSSGNMILPTLREYIKHANSRGIFYSDLLTYMKKYEKETNKKLNTRILPMRSNPCSKDSDYDEFDDGNDPNPLLKNLTEYHLKSKKYIGILYNDDDDKKSISYGGYQGWLNELKYNKFCNGKIDAKYAADQGCGLIAGADVLAYINIFHYKEMTKFAKKLNFETTTSTTVNEVNKDLWQYIGYNRFQNYIDNKYAYLNYLYKLSNKLTIGTEIITGVYPFMIPNSLQSVFNDVFNICNIKYRASWAPKYSQYGTYRYIEEMIKNNLPVIFSYDSHFFNKELPLYVKNSNNTFKKAASIKSHYMVITGIIRYTDNVVNKNKNRYRIMLEISSWGKKYYIDYDEYNEKTSFYSNILYIR